MKISLKILVIGLFLINIILAAVWVFQSLAKTRVTPKPQSIIESQITQCGTDFETNNNGVKKFVLCGLLSKNGAENIYLGKLTDVAVDKENNLLLSFEMYSSEQSNITIIKKLSAGNIGNNYIWITYQNGYLLYHTIDNYSTTLTLADMNLYNSLKQFKNQYLLFTVLNNDDLLKIDINTIEDKYKKDVEIRRENVKNCLNYIKSLLDDNLKNDNCSFAMIHSITFFQSN